MNPYKILFGIIIGPLFEGFLHYALHSRRVDFTFNLHREHHRNPRWERWVLVALGLCLLFRCDILFGGFIRYGFVHYLIHADSTWLPAYLKKHHMDHHEHGSKNWCVSATWF